jgi:hypothetical protein
MKIYVVGYPTSFTFDIPGKLPRFDGSCKKRDRILRDAMKRLKVNSPNHAYEDYVVEIVEDTGNGEAWHLGS